MALKITDLGPATLPLAGTEQLEVVQDNQSRRISVSALATPPGLDATFVTVTANPDLANERILTAGANVSIVDGGAGNPITISLPTALTGVSVNGVTLSNAGPATNYLDESGNYSTPPAGSPGGADTQVQFNDSGVFGASANLTWDDNTFAITNTTSSAPALQFNLGNNPSVGIVMDSTLSTNYIAWRMNDQTGANYFLWRHDYGLSTPNHELTLESSQGGTLLEFENEGNCHLGGTEGNAPIHIITTTANDQVRIDSTASIMIDGRAAAFADQGGYGQLYVLSGDGGLYYKPDGAPQVRLDVAGVSTLAALTDVDLTGQAQYDLFYNVDGANWEDTAGNLIFNSASQFLQLAAGHSLNFIDGSAVSRPIVEIASSGQPSVTIEHTTVEVIAEVSTSSNTEVAVPGGTLPQLTEGNEYLLIAVAQHHQGNTGGENIHGADIAVATGSGVPFSNMRDDIEPPAAVPASNQGQWFTGLNQIQYSFASHGLITLEHSAGATATHYVNNAILMAFNLTDFGIENTDWFSSVTAPFVTVTDAGWTNLSPSITIGDGVSDWLIFGSFQADQPQAGGQIQFGLFDGSVNTEYAMHQFADIADIKSIFFSAVVQGIASTTFQTAARAVAASGNTARIFTSGIYALRLNRFAQYSIQSAVGPTNPGSGAEFSLLTDSVVASGSSDWGIMAFVQNRWAGNSLSGTVYGRANINAGGFTTIAGFDTPPVSVVENAAVERTPKFMVPRITELTGVVATDTVGAELRWIPATTFGTDEANLYNMVMFTWDTFDSSVEETTLGDPNLDTRIDGSALSIAGSYTLPVADGTVGQVLTTDGAGTVTFQAAGGGGGVNSVTAGTGLNNSGTAADPVLNVDDPLTLASIHLTSALIPAAGAPYNNVPINIGANLIGTQGMLQLARQRIQSRPSGFSFNSTLFIQQQGGDCSIGDLNGANVTVNNGVAVELQHTGASTIVAQTATPAAGGFQVNNQATGVGLERVLTTSDLGGGGVTNPLTADLDGDGFDLDDMGVLFMREQASADPDVATQGQLWVQTRPFSNQLMFTNDNGNDIILAGLPDSDLSAGTNVISGTGFVAVANIGNVQSQNYMLFCNVEVTAPAADDILVQLTINTGSVFKGVLTYAGSGITGGLSQIESATGTVITNNVLVPTSGSASPSGTYVAIQGLLIPDGIAQTVSLRVAKNADTGANGAAIRAVIKAVPISDP